MLAQLNEAARRGAVTETVSGVTVEDPYRSLEADTPETRAWIDRQTERTEAALRGWHRPETSQRLEQLLSIGSLTGVSVGGDRVFYLKRDGGREQPALFVIEGGQPRATPVIDPLTYGERAALDWYFPSPRGRYVAFGISQNGDERSTLRVLEVSTGRVLSDEIPHTKWSRVSWLHSERGFYYTRYPVEGEARWEPEAQDTYWPEVFFHQLGTPAAGDRPSATYSGTHERTDFPAGYVSDDDRWLVVNLFRGWSASDVYLVDRRAAERAAHARPPAPAPTQALLTGRDNLTTGVMHRGKLYMMTNVDAPRYRIAVVDDPHAASDTARWRDVVAQGPASIEDFAIAGDRIYVHYVEDVRSRLRVFDLAGHEAGEIELPTRGSIDSLSVSEDGHTAAFSFGSFFYPPSLFVWNATTRALARADQVATDVDVSAYELEQAQVPSADGTPINVYLVHRRGMERNGHNRVLLSGYGGFNVSLLPTFTRHVLYWLEQGGVYAVANLRGGNEFGEDWHRAGNLLNKIHVFEDMEAVIRWLSSSGISAPDRIGITGGSNGGLLMGAMITRCPDAFRATATYVGLYDMMRFHRFPPAELWVTEYGNADENAEQARYLYSYSPYHRVVAGRAYPSVLVETADHDSRVYWGHSTKFAARLQEATSSERPILFYMERQVGHGAGTRLSDLVDRYVRMYSFFEHELAR